jgi:hypothetical protein
MLALACAGCSGCEDESTTGGPPSVGAIPPDTPASYSPHPDLLLDISRTRVLARTRAGVSELAARAAIERVGALVAEAAPDVGLYVAAVPDPGDHSAVDALVAALTAAPEILVASRNPLLYPTLSTGAPEPPLVPIDWRWDGIVEWTGVYKTGDHANWGLELARVPALWNLRDWMVRRNGDPAPLTVVVYDYFGEGLLPPGDLDMELFGDHLGKPKWGEIQAPADKPPDGEYNCRNDFRHGVAVASVLGAKWNNRNGIDGVLPQGVRLVGATHYARPPKGTAPSTTLVAAGGVSLQVLIFGLREVMAAYAPVDVLNLSLGYPWGKECRDRVSAVTDKGDCTWAHKPCAPDGTPVRPSPYGPKQGRIEQEVVAEAAMFAGVLDAAASPRLVVTATSGNESDTYPGFSSYLASPFVASAYVAADAVGEETASWLAAKGTTLAELGLPRREVIIVGALAKVLGGVERAVYSNEPAMIRAGGTAVGYEWVDGTALGNGTSVAAPLVAGVVAALQLLEPGLAAADAIKVLLDNAPFFDPNGNFGSPWAAQALFPSVDAFAAAMALDGLGGADEPRLQIALADVDDHTTDGCRRISLKDDGDVDRPLVAGAAVEPGDGAVDMRDFRRIRDAHLLVDKEGAGLDAVEVGGELHPKMDLNRDGRRTPVEVVYPYGTGIYRGENIWPRVDLNGDGTLHPDRKAPFKGALKSDLEVLAGVWGRELAAADAPPNAREPDREGWAVEGTVADRVKTLGKLLSSFDVEVRVGRMFKDPNPAFKDVKEVEVHVWRATPDNDPEDEEPPRGGMPLDPKDPLTLSERSRRVASTAAEEDRSLVFTVPIPAVPDGKDVYVKAYYVTNPADPNDWAAAAPTFDNPLGPSAVAVEPTRVRIGGAQPGNDFAVSFGPEIIVPTQRYVTFLLDKDKSFVELRVNNLDGSFEDLLAPFMALPFDQKVPTGGIQCSATGQHVVYQIGGKIYVLPFDASSAHELDFSAPMQTSNVHVDDLETRLVWLDNFDARVRDLKNSMAPDKIFDLGVLALHGTSLSPDGKRLLFTDMPSTPTVGMLESPQGDALVAPHQRIVDLDTGTVSLAYDKLITAVSGGKLFKGRAEPFSASFAPNGTDIVFASVEDLLLEEKKELEMSGYTAKDIGYEVYTATPGTPTATRHTFGSVLADGVKYQPRISPNGKQVIFWKADPADKTTSVALEVRPVGGSFGAILKTAPIGSAAVLMANGFGGKQRAGVCWLKD